MKVLLVKTSSMGDLLHTLPALTEAGEHIANIRFDWVVEEAFAEIPTWHPLVDRVITVPWRRIRKKPFTRDFWRVLNKFKQELRAQTYDYVIDAQGLLKSAVMACFARGVRCGGDAKSARETLASWFYQKHVSVSRQQHAVARMRKLFAAVLGYDCSDTLPSCDIQLADTTSQSVPYVVFLHGTTWQTKHWPEDYWRELAHNTAAQGVEVKLLWGSPAEKAKAERISQGSDKITVMPKMSLRQIAELLMQSTGAVAVDTGLAHLAAALAVPTVSLYGPTNARLTGACGNRQLQLSSTFACSPCLRDKCNYSGDKTIDPPCFAELNPDIVLTNLKDLIGAAWPR